MLPKARSLREQLSRCTGMVAEGRAEGPQRRYAPDAMSGYPRAGHSKAVVLGFAQHAFDRSTGGVVRRHHMYDQTFQRAFKRAVEALLQEVSDRGSLLSYSKALHFKTLLTGRISPRGIAIIKCWALTLCVVHASPQYL